MKTLPCTIAFAVMASVSMAAETEFKSGLQVGDYPGAFYVTDVTGPSAGEPLCYRCQYSTRPVVSIFARTMTEEVQQLVREIDALVGTKQEERLAAFVVLLTDAPREQASTLVNVAKEQKLVHTPLTTYKTSSGPGKYRIHKDAAVTVMMWVENDVKVNHAFTKDQLDGSAIKQIVSDTSTILN